MATALPDRITEAVSQAARDLYSAPSQEAIRRVLESLTKQIRDDKVEYDTLRRKALYLLMDENW